MPIDTGPLPFGFPGSRRSAGPSEPRDGFERLYRFPLTVYLTVHNELQLIAEMRNRFVATLPHIAPVHVFMNSSTQVFKSTSSLYINNRQP